MKTGLIGLSSTGKTTLFNLLTQIDKEKLNMDTNNFKVNIGVAKIPDDRIEYLSNIYKPKKITYASIELYDVPGIIPDESNSKGSSNKFFDSIRMVDALVHVVRVFKDENIIHCKGAIDPLRDIEMINMELLLSDLFVIENRIERIENSKKITTDIKNELEVLKKCKEALEQEQLINTIDLNDEEKKYLKTFDFLTERPMILVMNLDEEQITNNSYEKREKVISYGKEKNIPIVEICAKIELEINLLNEEDKKVFMEDLGIEKSGISNLANASYNCLGLISFLTVGQDEVRAWPIKKGINAKKAGGKIHSDIERGFIRAEVVKYNDFFELGSMSKVKEKGLSKLETNQYIISDGDIINFKFNV